MNEQTKLFTWLFLLIAFLLLYYFIIQKWFETNNEKVLYILLIVTIIFSPPFVWYTVSLKSSFGFILPEHIDAWIGFYGAIIGGALTLFGVWWTITDQNKKRKEDQELRDKERLQELSAQYKPILKIVRPEDEKEKKIIVRTDDPNCIYINIMLNIENIGRGEALNISATHSPADDFTDLPQLLICNTFQRLLISLTESECLPTNETRQVMLQIIVDRSFSDYDAIAFYLDLTFHDAFLATKDYFHSAKIVLRNDQKYNPNITEKYALVVTNQYK